MLEIHSYRWERVTQYRFGIVGRVEKIFMQRLFDDSHCSINSLVESIGRQSRRPFEEHFKEKTLILVNLINLFKLTRSMK